MRLTVIENKNLAHKDIATCVGWISSEEVFTCGDDHKLMKWMVESEEGSIVNDFGENFYPTDMQWLPRLGSDANRRNTEVLAIGTAEGKVWLVNKLGRVEKSFEAHIGAVLCLRWSWDAGALMTGGEDGIVKIWSRSGMLRSSLAQNSIPVYSGAWSPSNDQVLYSSGKQLIIKSLQANVKPIIWKAHDSVVLKVDWCPQHAMIISGGEDCRYKLWNSYGQLIHASGAHDYPITSLAWSPDGALFAVAGFDLLRLCDKYGWSHSLERTAQSGSLLGLSWSADSTQLAATTGSGRVILAHVTGYQMYWRFLTASLRQDRRRIITIHNPIDVATESLEFRDRVVKSAFGHHHLVVATVSHCYIYSTKNWNTPVVLDLKESRAALIILSTKSFLLVDGGGIFVYSYEGRLLANPRAPTNVRVESLDAHTISIASDLLAVIGGVPSTSGTVNAVTNSQQIVSLLDIGSSTVGSNTNYRSIQHQRSITWLELDQYSNKRHLALLDETGELWLYPTGINVGGASSSATTPTKLAGQVTSAVWHETGPFLVATLTAPNFGNQLCLAIWPRPSLAPTAVIYVSTNHPSSNLLLQSYWEGSRVLLRRQNDGSFITMSVPAYLEALHQVVGNISGSSGGSTTTASEVNKWNQALTLCRSVNDQCLWRVLAALAVHSKDLDAAQMAYAALNDVDRVEYLERAKHLPTREARNAELLMAAGRLQEAESTLISAGLLWRAVLIQLRLYCWDKALNLAQDNPQLLEIVLGYRRRFLERIDRTESSKAFLVHANMEVPEWDVIKEKVAKFETSSIKAT